MATHSSILTQRILWTEEPGGLLSMRSQSQTRLKRLNMHAYIGEGNGNPLQYFCLENPVDRGAWWAAVYGVAEVDTTERTQQQQHTWIDVFHQFWKIFLLSYLFLIEYKISSILRCTIYVPLEEKEYTTNALIIINELIGHIDPNHLEIYDFLKGSGKHFLNCIA